jgi:hypothetical protein
MINVPNFNELTAKKIWQQIKYNPLFMDFLPEFESIVPPR